MNHLSLKWELLFICILLVTLPTVLMGMVGYYAYQSFAKQTLESQLHKHSQEVRSQAYDFIAQNERVLRREEALVLKRIKSVAQLSKSIFQTYPAQMKPTYGDTTLHSALQTLSQFRLNRSGHIFLLDENFNPVINNQLLPSLTNPTLYANLISHIKKEMPYILSGQTTIIKHPWSTNPNGIIYRQTALTYLDNWQMLLGVTINETDYKSHDFEVGLQNELRDRLASERIGKSGYIWVFNGQGEYIVSKDNLRNGENMLNIVDQHGHSIVEHLISSAKSAPPGGSEIIFYEWQDLGESSASPRAAAVTYVAEWDWFIGTNINLIEFYSGLREVRNKILHLCVVFILIGSLIAYYFAKRITTPIKHLEHLAVKAAQGDFNVQADPKLASRHTEINSLSNVFSEMICNIRQLMAQKEKSTQLLAARNTALQASEDKLTKALLELEYEKQKFHTQAITDSLTNLLNRRGFSKEGKKVWKRHQRTNEPLTIAIIDIDYFKRINDKYSHSIGDDVLIQLAKLLTNHMRENDIVARIGGEEFSMIISQPLCEAKKGLERLRRLVENTPIISDKREIFFTISIGAIEVNPQLPSLESALDAADTCLYAAKRSGRNKIIT